MFALISRIITIMVFCFSSLIVYAKDIEVTRMLNDLKNKQSSTKLKQHAMAMGKQRALLCSQCHGKDGNSVQSYTPNLASQNPIYLLEQINKFADGSRKNYVMNALSKNLSDEDKVNLAIFYANMRVKQVKTDPQLAAKGQPLYASKCSVCHGEDGIGKANFARIAGQQVQYVEATLRRFRQNANMPLGQKAKRRSSIMEGVTKVLSDDDIKALAAYIGQMH